MEHRSSNRSPGRRRAPLALALGLLALLGPAAQADGTPARAHAAGYPRSSDVSPGPLTSAADDHGDPNTGSTGTQYDTNWFLDADPGDEDAAWMIVHQACITSGGIATSDDPSSGVRRSQRGWGEDRLEFSVVDASDEDVAANRVVIVVRNDLAVHASWTVEGNGRNYAIMDARLLDILGKTHGWFRHRHVDPTATYRTTNTSQESDEHDSGTRAGKDENGPRVAIQAHERQSDVDGAWSATEVTTSATDSGADGWGTTVEKRFRATSCAVRIASSALLEVKAQAIAEGVATSSNVHEFDLLNVVEASYVVDAGPPSSRTPSDPPPPPEPAGPTTPGGNGPAGPTTPGGSGGSAPGGTDGAAPGGGGSAPGTPAVPGGSEPKTPPGDRPLPQEPGPATPPAGGGSTSSRGPDLPDSGAEGGTSGGSAPQGGGGTDVGAGAASGGTSPSGDGGAGLPRGDGSAPTPSGESSAGGSQPGGSGFDGGTRPGEASGGGFSSGGASGSTLR